MLLDRASKGWVIWSVLAGAGGAAWFALDPASRHGRAGGSTTAGLTFGIAAFGIMVFCTALSLRRRIPHWNIGRAQTWLRGHIWLGLLTAWLIALHAAFKAGGPMTTFLWVLTACVTASGVFGVLLQQVVPRLLLHALPGETVAQQIHDQLKDAARQGKLAVGRIAGRRLGGKDDPEDYDLSASPETLGRVDAAGGGRGDAAGGPAAEPSPPSGHTAPSAASPQPAKLPKDFGVPLAGTEPLRVFFERHAAPYLRGTRSELEAQASAEALFTGLRRAVPTGGQDAISELEHWCARRRHLLLQRRWMRVLHGWLIVHIPLSWLFLGSVAVHAVQALHFWGGTR